ncbi:MAG TPA: hypothetical protein VFQ58_05140, partial [Flavisolibacter sp.]|nr:hypothetical protein [Flavisolibacter sp.]
MKILISTLVVAFSLSFSSSAQKVSGIYMGTLYNDSTKMVQNYELALSEYRGKITGYSYVTFVSRDTFYYGIRKIKASIVNDELIVEDDKIILNNFPESPAKRVKRITTIPLNGQDSLVYLKGRWRTNQTKEYYSVPGSITINRNNDSSRSALVNHLKELGIIAQEDTHTYSQDVAIVTPVKKDDNINRSNTDIVMENKKKSKSKTEKENKNNNDVALVNSKNTSVTDNSRKSDKENQKKQEDVAINNHIKNKTAPTVNVPVVLPYEQRRNHLMQTLDVSADSLLLSFYDNGVIDGDSITVYLNGVNIISHNRLTAVASKKMIDISKLGERIE